MSVQTSNGMNVDGMSLRDPDRHRVDSIDRFRSPRLHDQEMDLHLAWNFRDSVGLLAAGWFSSNHRRELFSADHPYKLYS